jgi:hypothetical protein
VFGNTQNKGLRRFTLRGKGKVSMQWKLFTLVHNIEKIANYAAAWTRSRPESRCATQPSGTWGES